MIGEPGPHTRFESRRVERWRVTVRHTDVELRGYVDGFDQLQRLASAVEVFGCVVVGSPVGPDYDPFDPLP